MLDPAGHQARGTSPCAIWTWDSTARWSVFTSAMRLHAAIGAGLFLQSAVTERCELRVHAPMRYCSAGQLLTDHLDPLPPLFPVWWALPWSCTALRHRWLVLERGSRFWRIRYRSDVPHCRQLLQEDPATVAGLQYFCVEYDSAFQVPSLQEPLHNDRVRGGRMNRIANFVNPICCCISRRRHHQARCPKGSYPGVPGGCGWSAR